MGQWASTTEQLLGMEYGDANTWNATIVSSKSQSYPIPAMRNEAVASVARGFNDKGRINR
jgi:hypothetical protein